MKQWCGSGMFIPDPNFFHPGSATKNLSILTQTFFLSSRKYNPGCSSRTGFRIRTDPDFLPIPEPGVKKALDTGSATLE